MFTSRANKMNVHFSKLHGVETFYFGTSRSKKQVRLYNKRVEMMEQGQGWCDNEDLWRFEMSFADSFFIDDEQSKKTIFQNPFLSFKYYDFDKVMNMDVNKPSSDFGIYSLFCAANVGLGIEATLNDFASKIANENTRKSFLKIQKKKLAEYEYSIGPIIPPSQVYNDQFLFEWNMLRGQLKGLFDFEAKA